MDERDTAAIIPGDVLSVKFTEEEKSTYGSCGRTDEAEVSTVRSWRPPYTCPIPVTVEPVMFLSMFSIALQSPLVTQYLWDRISDDLGYNGTKRLTCNNSSVDHTTDSLQRVTTPTPVYCFTPTQNRLYFTL